MTNPTEPAETGARLVPPSPPSTQDLQLALTLGFGLVSLLGIGLSLASLLRRPRRLDESDIEAIGEPLDEHAVLLELRGGDQLRLQYSTVEYMHRLTFDEPGSG